MSASRAPREAVEGVDYVVTALLPNGAVERTWLEPTIETRLGEIVQLLEREAPRSAARPTRRGSQAAGRPSVSAAPGGSLWLSADARETISFCHFNARIGGREVGGFLEGVQKLGIRYLIYAARNDTVANRRDWLQLRRPAGHEYLSGQSGRTGCSPIGIWHSHGDWPPNPSDADIAGTAAQAHFLGRRAVMLIVGGSADNYELRAWAVNEDAVAHPLRLVEGEREWDAPPAGWVDNSTG